MKYMITKWGNSYGIRIPKEVISALQLKEKSVLYGSVSDDSIILKKQSKEEELALLLKSVNKELETFDDEAKGKEIW